MVNEGRVLGRHAPFARLAELARHAGADGGRYLGDGFLADLLTWFHIAWFGEHRLRGSAELQALLARGGDYTLDDRRALLFLIGRELNDLIPRYRALAEAGRVELAVSPWAHPILPLLADFATGRDALPGMTLPDAAGYPGGEERNRWHLEQGIEAFREHFGFTPAGCWPSEGAVSEAAVAAIDAAGFRWLASGGQVLNNSLARHDAAPQCRHRMYRIRGDGAACFFRDDGLSDLIGFSYQHWNARDAVDNLIGHIDSIAALCDCPDALVAIVMDGENAWEHYPANGFEFLQTLYASLANHPGIRLTTFSDYLARDDVHAVALPSLAAGSWVHGTLATWIGNAPKNRAWELLVAAKAAWDRRVAEGFEPDAAARRELALCEGSDWFWWLDEFNEAETVARFDGLFRSHLRALYRILDVEPPAALDEPLVTGSVDGAAPVMRPAHG
jgi:alpha-amylase/alpha-mannosidase (GH57 family)